MKGKKIFPNKTLSDIFFINPKPKTPILSIPNKIKRNNINSTRQNSILSKRQNFHKKNMSVDNSEQKFKEKIIKKLDKKPISNFLKKKNNISFMFNEKYYNKFINKPNEKINSKIKLNSKDNNQITYELTKINNDNKIIDIQDLKSKFLRNGLNIYKINNCSSNLTPINKDKISFKINEKDSKNGKFIRIKNNLKRNGLEIKEKKIHFNKSFTQETYPAKNEWTCQNFGRRDKNLSFERYKNFNNMIKKGVSKNNSFSKSNLIDLKYKNIFLNQSNKL